METKNHCATKRRLSSRLDVGLLVLRGAGLLLALTFGRQKIGWYRAWLHSTTPLSDVGLAPLIRSMGFPVAVILAVWVTLNESIGCLLMASGLVTRIAATSTALGMAGALYVSLRLGEDWLRAALYLIIFSALALTGAGDLSLDQLIKASRRKKT